MTIEELKNKSLILDGNIRQDEAYANDIVKLSIQFAIDCLEEFTIIYAENGGIYDNDDVINKIDQLKKELQ